MESGSIDTVDKAKDFFEEQKNDLIHIKDQLINEAPAIKRIEKSREFSSEQYGVLSNLEEKIFSDILMKIKNIEIRHVSIFRDRFTIGGRLERIDFNLYSKGLAITTVNKTLGISFIPQSSSYIEMMEKKGSQRQFISLNKEDWYITQCQ